MRQTRAGRIFRGGRERRSASAAALALAVAALAAGPAGAQLSPLDSFLTDVCTTGLTGPELSARCGEADQGGTFELSGDSESSLDPTQTLRQNEATLQRSRTRDRAVQKRLEAQRDATRSGEGADGRGIASRLGFLLGGNATFVDYTERRGERGFDSESGGVQALVDYRFSDRLVAGMLFAWDRSDATFDEDDDGVNFTAPGDDGEMESDAYTLTLFGSVRPVENVFFDVNLGAGIAEYEFRRNAVFQETTRNIPQTNVRTKGDPDGWQIHTGATLGYEIPSGAALLAPYVRFHYVHTEVDDYRERDRNGSGLAIDVDQTERESLTSTVGIRGSYAVSTALGVLVPQLRVEYEHEFRRDREKVRTSYVQDAAGTVLRVRGRPPDRDYVNLGLGLVWILPHGIQPFVEYATVLDHDEYSRHRVGFGLRWEL